mmetsp:Transcript_89876/g.159907  ORF Transcript_89876/g.159907 Transcript_89876/m.159907 type:complete len:543 (-) Transcript_89876:25-1653(-)|eukprot:CAMPEP_0197622872 /NCGR_PEP_ID=MMETSP1338-20131121/2988_1 /TAXON_ID=43686 ORGANISM="Pelagodinium beii, Strain RCC1491" /NCGR_SAMPLE_ID=MMETSP1338 /ASSEMBLY_ACC=CAM_ASM_000754 /LENGTH=542 /DNA_ID=CAMNT_0043192643 /DNA_START=61 /DNA_END=1689 /DNA_ORIENTATION=+
MADAGERTDASVSKGDEAEEAKDMSFKEQTDKIMPAFMVEAAAIENRLRSHAMELVTPNIQRTGVLEGKLKNTDASIVRLGETMSELKVEVRKTDHVKAAVEDFRHELSIADDARREMSYMLVEKSCLQENDITALRKELEVQASANAANSRGLKNFGDLLTETKEELTLLRDHLTDKTNLNRDKLMKLRDEVEVRNNRNDAAQFRFQDDLTRMSTVFAHLKAEVERLASDSAETMDRVEILNRDKAPMTSVETQQQTFVEFARNVDAMVLQLRMQIHTMVDDLKGHFQTAADVVNTATSRQIQDMREKYLNDLEQVKEILAQNAGYAEQQKTSEKTVEENISSFRASFAQELLDLRGSIEKKLHTSDDDSSHVVMEVQQLQKRIFDLEKAAKADQKNRAVEKEVLMSVIETEMMNAHMNLQDDQDRKNIALFGYKPADHGKDGRLPEIDGGGWTSRTPRKRDKLEKGTMPAVSLEKRCLSCSGSPGTVLAGFKLACLQYAPGHVEYQKVSYSRAEVIHLQMKLIEQARNRLSQLKSAQDLL